MSVEIKIALKDVKALKSLVIQNKPKQWHREVREEASMLEARAAVTYEDIEQVKTAYKELKRLNLQIENAIEAFENLKKLVADEDSNEQRKLHHQNLLLIIEDAGVVNGLIMSL